MRRGSGWMVVTMVALAVAGLMLSGCAKASSAGEANGEDQATVEHVTGSDLGRVTITEDAARRLDLQTAPVRKAARGTVIPYSAVLYDEQGKTWAYRRLKSLTFERQAIEVDRIERNLALLSAGPAVGTRVVTVGAAELFGIEFEAGH
jgi:hypothetical protein